MAQRLVDQFGPDVVTRLAGSLPVPADEFVSAGLTGFDELGLMDRARHLADVMHRFLAPDPAAAVRQVHAAIGGGRPAGMAGFFYNPHSFFIGTYGLPAFAESMAAMYDLTKVFTAESCVRPFILQHAQTMEILRQWAGDPDEHVRRLVSEGTRPRLPWATQLPQFRADPAPVLELLDLLKDDPSQYVRRSVANNLNDISKDHPQVVLDLAAQWYPGREGLIRRALRTLIKAGDAQAISVLGYTTGSPVTARALLPERLDIGQTLRLQIELSGTGAVLVDILVHFVKADGTTSAKVFKGAEVDVDGHAVVRRSISFAQLSTRRLHPGPHRIGVLVNGQEQDLGVVEVVRRV